MNETVAQRVDRLRMRARKLGRGQTLLSINHGQIVHTLVPRTIISAQSIAFF